jgi:hypothetical protein
LNSIEKRCMPKAQKRGSINLRKDVQEIGSLGKYVDACIH